MIYVMSDIHGNSKAFHSVLEQIKLTENNSLYILGDVIDQHPYGIDLLQEIIKMHNTKMLLVNHEYMMLEAADFDKSSDYNRGRAGARSKRDKLCILHISARKRVYTFTRRIVSCSKTNGVNREVKEKGTPELSSMYSL